MHRTFHESVRFPWPRKPVQVVLSKRDRENAFQQIWSTAIDPNSRFVDAADREPMGKVWSVIESGPPAEKVDLLLIAEGYTAEEMPKVPARCGAAHRQAFRAGAVQEPPQRLQCVGAGAAVRAQRSEPAARR
jgi:hypothetical protein